MKRLKTVPVNTAVRKKFSSRQTFPAVLIAASIILISGCSTSRPGVSTEGMEPSSLTPSELASLIPDYSDDLQTIRGSGRVIVSEPGNSDRATLEFSSDRMKSLITIRSGVGIQGGQVLIGPDSLLIYNRVDNYAEKVSLEESRLSGIGSLASVNLLDLVHFTFRAEDVARISENQEYYAAYLKNSAVLTISKADGWIVDVEVQQPENETLPYSRVQYEGYAEIEGFHLPRKITIFSSDGSSRATFLVQRLEVNRELPPLDIELPDDIPIYQP